MSKELSRLYKAVYDSEFSNPKYRPTMEDVHVIIPDFGNLNKFSFFAVYDGHGGQELAKFSGKRLSFFLEERLREPNIDLLKSLRYSYLMTDIESRVKCGEKSGCTAITCLLSEENGVRKLYTANAGDARAVLCKGGNGIRLSYDHKASDSSESKRVEKSGGFIMMSRVMGVLAISRSIGDHSLKKYVISEPNLTEIVLNQECEFLVVACDGLWDVMSDQEVVDCVKALIANNSADLARDLIQRAVELGTQDNVSIIVVIL